MRQRLRRPVLLVPALVLLSLGAGIGYAAWTQLNGGRVEANERLLAALPLYPGAEEVDRQTRTSTGGAFPLPDEVVTTVLYAPPPRASQADVVAFFVERLTPEWTATTSSVSVGEVGAEDGGAATFRVDFSRGDDCLQLLTFGMAPGHLGERTFALSAESGEGSCSGD
jgi:hypothetical protein